MENRLRGALITMPTTPAVIHRRFADLTHGQVHFRTAGDGVPIVLLHASPGSSKQLTGLIGDLAETGCIIAPDTPGNGDSDALPLDAPTIVDLAVACLALLDTLGLETVRLYGSHTGAAIASEVAILAPDRVTSLILDGVQVLTPEAREEILRRYAHPFVPDLDGAYLVRAFQFCRDQYMFYPWYERTAAARRTGGLPAARTLHEWVLEVLKANETYHRNYHAAFTWCAPERLPLITCPTLVVAAENDPLIDETRAVAPLLNNHRFVALPRLDADDYRAARKAVILNFLGHGLKRVF